jgi:hypothetical protein
MNLMAGKPDAISTKSARRCWSGWLALQAMALGLGIPTMARAQAVVPACRPCLPGAACYVPPTAKTSQSGPQPIPASLLRSAIMPPPAQTIPPPMQVVVPIPTVPVPVVSAGEEKQHDSAQVAGSLEEKHLLPLLLKEQELLKYFGSDHPEVQSVRARIRIVRDWLANQPAPIVRVEARTPVEPPAPARPQPTPEPLPELKAPVTAVAPPPVVERVIEVRQAAAEQPASSSMGIMVQLVSIFAALVVMLLVQLLALMLFLRRYGDKLTPQVRVEVVNGAGNSSAPGEVLSQRVYLDSSETPPRHEFPPPMPEMPSFEEVRNSEEESAQQQDEAVFRQVFEDNLRLQEQLAAQ